MRGLLIPAALVAFAWPAMAAEIRSEYTDLDLAKSCALVASEGEGGFARRVCPGWRGYPVVVDYGDARESVFYGFPPATEESQWESFSAFNSTGAKIEWRLQVDGEVIVPFAAIHRWFVNDDPDEPEARTEVLVIEKVGQPGKGEGCTVGLVVASGNPKANETARRIADEQAQTFACGADERVLVSGEVPLPDYQRAEN
ncbi:MAG: hypothetical protein KF914_07770 [Rhizobiaceae bacterium]|nr:hypothetical protein [Rhizobiaceae bacterium]